MGFMDSDETASRTGHAFCLVVAAAGATALGSCAVFYPPLAEWATGRVLSASLGFATGVMLYVSLIDIYSKSISGFQDQGFTPDQAFIYTTMSFFAGVLIMKVIDMAIHRCTSNQEYQIEVGMEEMVARNEMRHQSSSASTSLAYRESQALVGGDKRNREAPEQQIKQDNNGNPTTRPVDHAQQQAPHLQHVSGDSSRIASMESGYSSSDDDARSVTTRSSRITTTGNPLTTAITSDSSKGRSNPPPVRDLLELIENGFSTTRTEPTASCVTENAHGEEDDDYADGMEDRDQQKQLFSMGAVTAAAIALHNFPEGLVTFVAYVEDPAVGVALAIGIAIHNIPEGLCVSMPIYYATNSRWTAFWWGSLSGLSEPFGALTGWLILQSSFSGKAYGILFGCVAGMMVFICLDELLPMAFKFDPHGSIVTWTCLAGMFLVALSLILFSL
ncbi:hypothetical protein ACA910_016457 [Epithemia clementina (nom. ined.)]